MTIKAISHTPAIKQLYKEFVPTNIEVCIDKAIKLHPLIVISLSSNNDHKKHCE